MGFFQENNLKRHILSHNVQAGVEPSNINPITVLNVQDIRKPNGNHQSLVKTTTTKSPVQAITRSPVIVRSQPPGKSPIVSKGPIVKSPISVKSPIAVKSPTTGKPPVLVRSPTAARAAPTAS